MAAAVLPGRSLLHGVMRRWCRGLSGTSAEATGGTGLTEAILREKNQQQASEGGGSKDSDEQQKEQKQKESTAYAKKMVLRLAGLMGIGSAGAVVYVFVPCWSQKAKDWQAQKDHLKVQGDTSVSPHSDYMEAYNTFGPVLDAWAFHNKRHL